jgi:myo-inositol-1(or 4)-monophosphatase
VNEPSLRQLLAVAVEVAREGGRRTLAYFQSGAAVELKGDGTPVTRADREAEAAMRARIARTFPDHAILGEEEGETGGRAP